MQDGSVSPIKAFFRNKWVRVILLVDLLIIVFIIITLIINARKTAVIEFNIVPSDSQILVNGGSYSNGSYRITPGIYEVQISHPNLDTKTFTVDLMQSNAASITTFLHQEDNFNFYKIRDNLDSFFNLADIASANHNQTTDHDTSAEAFITDFQQNYSLYSTELPLTYSEYDDNGELTKYISVRASYNCDITLCLETRIYNEDDKSIVEALLLGAGFNVEDFEIEYKFY